MSRALAASRAAPLSHAQLALPDLIAERVRAYPRRIVLHEVVFGGGAPLAAPCSYAELSERMQALAGALAEAGVGAGDRVLLSLGGAGGFLAALAATQSLGAIPVPLPSLGELPLPSYLERIGAVANDCRPSAILADDTRAVEALPPSLRAGVALLDPSALPTPTRRSAAPLTAAGTGATAGTGAETRCPTDAIAFVQYTSGSTGSPKGVVVRHRNVLANLAGIIEHGAIGNGDVVFSWLPLFHDMGLVAGLLLGVYAGLPTYIAAPRSFITRPDSWLRAISGLGATISFGPNFAYDLLARRVRERTLSGLDLSRWRLAFNGAEPVAAATLQRFRRRFAPCGLRADCLRPAFGMAECTLGATFAPAGTPLRIDCIDRVALATRGIAEPVAPGAASALEVTSVGEALPGHRITIRDPDDRRELPERSLGEIVIEGPSLASGYFRAEGAPSPLPSDRGRSGLCSGDLGYLADGQLYVVDRLKDLLIVAGRKYAPSDIERVVGALPGIRPGAVVAFARPGEHGTDELCIAAALERAGDERREQIEHAVSRAVYERFALTAAHVLLLRAQDLPKTSSGKLRRAACRSLLPA